MADEVTAGRRDCADDEGDEEEEEERDLARVIRLEEEAILLSMIVIQSMEI